MFKKLVFVWTFNSDFYIKITKSTFRPIQLSSSTVTNALEDIYPVVERKDATPVTDAWSWITYTIIFKSTPTFLKCRTLSFSLREKNH